MNKNSVTKRGTNRRNNTRVTGTRQNRAVMLSHPPQINGLEIRHSVTLRYRVTAAVVNQALTFQNLLDTMLTATTAIAGTNMFQSVRIRAVRLWAVPALGAAASVACEFGGLTAGSVGDQAIHTDTSMGIQPAHVSCSPSNRSLASNFQLSSAAIALIVSMPAGSVIDVDLTFRSQFVAANAAAANALVGANPGGQYIRGLDGLAAAGSNYVPEYAVAVI